MQWADTHYAGGVIMAGDASYPSVVLLLNGDGANNSTIFTDRSISARAVTSVNGAKISTTQSKFGGSSMFFDGTNDYLSVPASADFVPNADFTIEAWVYCPNTATGTTQRIAGFATTGGGNSSMTFHLKADGRLEIAGYDGSGFTIATSTSAVSSNAWVHVVGQRRSGEIEVWIAGSLDCTPVAVSGTFVAPVSPLSVGRMGDYVGQYFSGYIDELRITKGVARYTTTFTPPAAAFQEHVAEVSGSVVDSTGAAASRTVRAYRRDTGAFLKEGVSTSGSYNLKLPYAGDVNVICLDDVAGTVENDLILRTTAS